MDKARGTGVGGGMAGLPIRSQHTETKIKVERIGQGEGSAVKDQPEEKEEANRRNSGTKIRNFS